MQNDHIHTDLNWEKCTAFLPIFGTKHGSLSTYKFKIVLKVWDNTIIQFKEIKGMWMGGKDVKKTTVFADNMRVYVSDPKNIPPENFYSW